jgi:hypothetical protein
MPLLIVVLAYFGINEVDAYYVAPDTIQSGIKKAARIAPGGLII